MLDGAVGSSEESGWDKTAPFAIGVILSLILLGVCYWRRASSGPGADGGSPYKKLPTAEIELGGSAGGDGEQWEEDWEESNPGVLPSSVNNNAAASSSSSSSQKNNAPSIFKQSTGIGGGGNNTTATTGGSATLKVVSTKSNTSTTGNKSSTLGLPIKKRPEYGSTDSNEDRLDGRVGAVVTSAGSSAGGSSGLSGSLGGLTGGLGLGALSTSYAMADSRDHNPGSLLSSNTGQAQGQGLGLAPMKNSPSSSKPPPAAKVAPPSGNNHPNPTSRTMSSFFDT